MKVQLQTHPNGIIVRAKNRRILQCTSRSGIIIQVTSFRKELDKPRNRDKIIFQQLHLSEETFTLFTNSLNQMLHNPNFDTMIQNGKDGDL